MRSYSLSENIQEYCITDNSLTASNERNHVDETKTSENCLLSPRSLYKSGSLPDLGSYLNEYAADNHETCLEEGFEEDLGYDEEDEVDDGVLEEDHNDELPNEVSNDRVSLRMKYKDSIKDKVTQDIPVVDYSTHFGSWKDIFTATKSGQNKVTY